MVAFAIPLLFLRPPATPMSPAGVALLAVGALVLGWCVRDFYVLGRGTLAPWSPPTTLVVRGLYRYSRNPMYVGVLAILAAWAIGFASRALAWYAVAIAVAFHLRVVFGEEPWLARTHGADWIAYRARVPRWFGWRRVAPTTTIDG